MKLKVKVCGMRDADNIRDVESLGIDMIGFIFWPKSSRYVSEMPAYIPKGISRVGVFVDEDIERVHAISKQYSLTHIQLHGNESPSYIRSLRSVCGCATATSPAIIKAFNIASASDLTQTIPYEGLADYFLFDTKGKSIGGNGEKFDWSLLSSYNAPTPFLLSGGIGTDDADIIRSFHHPKCIGIDINSRFEISPGLKDAAEIGKFLKKVKS